MVAKLIQTGAVSSIAWFSNEEVIASSSISGDILLHSVKTGSLLESFKTRDSINNIKLAADKKIAACTNSGSILYFHYYVVCGMWTQLMANRSVIFQILKNCRLQLLAFLSVPFNLLSLQLPLLILLYLSMILMIISNSYLIKTHQNDRHRSTPLIGCLPRKWPYDSSRWYEWCSIDIRLKKLEWLKEFSFGFRRPWYSDKASRIRLKSIVKKR